MRLWFLAVILTFQLAGQVRRAQPNATPAAPYTGPRGSLSGTVVDSVTGFPIRKAQVSLNSSDVGSVVTDASGSFRFDQVPPGSYYAQARHASYPPFVGIPSGEVNAKLGPGEEKRGLEIRLSPAASVSGRIVDEEGDPLPGCRVSLLTRSGLSLVPLATAASDKNGDYTISAAPSGKHYLEVKCLGDILQPRPYGPPDAIPIGNQVGYASLFYPGARDFSAAQRVKLLPGQTAQGLDFRVIPEPFTRVTVTISGTQLDPQRRLSATLTRDDSGPFRPFDAFGSSQQGRSSELRFSVPTGKYMLRIMSPPPEQVLLLKQPVQVGEEPSRVTAQVTAPAPLTGIVHVTNTDPQPGQIFLSPVGEQGRQLQPAVNPDGTFKIAAIVPGRYHLSAQETWVQSGTIGGESFDGPDFELKAGASGPLEINMGSGRGKISGDVEIGSSQSARIMIVAKFIGIMNSSVQTELEEATGQPPHFTAQLPPGSYRLYAIEYTPGGNYSQALNDESIDARGVPVDIRTGSESVKNLKLITAEDIERVGR